MPRGNNGTRPLATPSERRRSVRQTARECVDAGSRCAGLPVRVGCGQSRRYRRPSTADWRAELADGSRLLPVDRSRESNDHTLRKVVDSPCGETPRRVPLRRQTDGYTFAARALHLVKFLKRLAGYESGKSVLTAVTTLATVASTTP